MKQPIGIFDSGVGGLTVAKAVRDLLPHEDLLYFGDTAHLPYGEKSPEAIRSYSKGIARFLADSDAKAIIIACNSASSVATQVLKDQFEPTIPIINVIDPVVESIDREVKRIGIIGTRATIASQVYQRKIEALNHDYDIRALATPLFVPVIEEGLEDSAIATKTAEHYLSLPEMQNIQTLIPGCTHYPLLTELFQKILGDGVAIMNTPKIVAQHTLNTLKDMSLLASNLTSGSSKFFVSDYTDTFERIARHFFNANVQLEESDIWK